MMAHAGIRPHVCDKCGKSFVQLNILNAHVKRKHGGKKSDTNGEIHPEIL
jgi:hypothetical protein